MVKQERKYHEGDGLMKLTATEAVLFAVGLVELEFENERCL